MYTKRFFNTICVTVILIIFCFQGCTNEDGTNIENDIINSVEMEEFIIAGLDYQQSVNTFNSEIKNIDFSKLKTSSDSEGNMIVYIPTSVCIEEKFEILNKKKEALLEMYPQFISLSQNTVQIYLQQCAEKSLDVKNKLFETGININQPRLKRGTIETFNSTNDYWNYLASYVYNAYSGGYYVETFLVVFTNGSAITYTDDRNTSSTCYSTGFTQINGQWYANGYLNCPIAYVAHTHIHSSTPSPADMNLKNKYPDISFAIYYSGVMVYY